MLSFIPLVAQEEIGGVVLAEDQTDLLLFPPLRGRQRMSKKSAGFFLLSSTFLLTLSFTVPSRERLELP